MGVSAARRRPSRFAPCIATCLAMCLAACGTSLDLGSNDAGIPYEASCAPGTYVGIFQCSGGGSATDSAIPIGAAGISANGTLSLDLRPAGAHVLALPPDAS